MKHFLLASALATAMIFCGCADDPFDPGPVDAPSSMSKPHSMDSGNETIQRTSDANPDR
jgi:hypothetical protein